MTYVSSAQNIALNNMKKMEQKGGRLEFDKVIVFLNGGCNLNCLGCYVKVDKDSNSRLPYEKIKEAMLFGKARGARFFVIPGYGEPLMDTNFWPSLELARSLSLQPVVYSNSTLIDEHAAERLKELDAIVFAKRNTFKDKLQDELVGKQGASITMKQGMKNLMDTGFRSPKLGLESYVIKPILNDLKDVLRFCRQNNLLPYFEAFENPSPDLPSHIISSLMTDQELSLFFDELALIDRKEFGLDVSIPVGSRVYCFSPEMPTETPVISFDGERCCDRIYTAFCVAHTGDVRLCVNHQKSIGNIFRASLEDILNPAKNDRLRDVFLLPCSYESAKYTGGQVDPKKAQ